MKNGKIKKIYLRVYRTHDYDLMMLHHTGTLNIGHAMEQALIAYFKGDYFKFSLAIKPALKEKLPSKSCFLLQFDEAEVPGITVWLGSMTTGYRNGCIKNILRSYLSDPCVTYYRTDGWLPAARDYPPELLRPPVHLKRRGRKPKGSEWLNQVAKSKPKKNPNAKISDIDELLERSKPKLPQPKDSILNMQGDDKEEDTGLSYDEAEEGLSEEDSGFNAFSMFNQLRSME